MKITIDSTKVLDLLGDHGEHWAKGTWGNDERMCLHGAIRRCQPQPGDAFVVEQVAARLGWGVKFNDDHDTTWGDVRARIVAGLEVTDADLADTFGPQWEQIVALVRQAAILTTDEAQRLDAAWDAAWAAARDAARAAAWAAAWDAAWDAALDAARAATWDAAWALIVRDLIGQHGFTRAHYDLLTMPWATVIGKVHPDDAEVRAAL